MARAKAGQSAEDEGEPCYKTIDDMSAPMATAIPNDLK